MYPVSFIEIDQAVYEILMRFCRILIKIT